MMKSKNMLMLSNHDRHFWTEMRVEWIFKLTHNAKYIPQQQTLCNDLNQACMCNGLSKVIILSIP